VVVLGIGLFNKEGYMRKIKKKHSGGE